MNLAATRTTLALGALTLFSATAFAQAPCQTTPFSIHITAGTLDNALTALSTQIGCPVQYNKKQVQQFRAPAVQGKLTAAEALTRLVQGTGLEAHSDAKGLSISQADQEQIKYKATTLQAQLGQAIKAQTVALSTANVVYGELGEVRTSVISVAKQQGFVSAAENASYQRVFTKAARVLANEK